MNPFVDKHRGIITGHTEESRDVQRNTARTTSHLSLQYNTNKEVGVIRNHKMITVNTYKVTKQHTSVNRRGAQCRFDNNNNNFVIFDYKNKCVCSSKTQICNGLVVCLYKKP